MTRKTRKALAAWMRENGWTQMRFAAHVGCSQTHISQMLSGKIQTGLEVAVRIADLTGFPVNEVATDQAAQRVLEAYVNRLLSERGFPKDNSSVA